MPLHYRGRQIAVLFECGQKRLLCEVFGEAGDDARRLDAPYYGFDVWRDGECAGNRADQDALSAVRRSSPYRG
jgi:hypothetical protein